ncbi:acyl-CoA thioesterase [Megasphaera hominis]|uniref:Acyl-CoA thioesterase n=1 Tax=Megasphaera hominis TaxID=159836 RepID=A0ABR6VLP5_9FIRM|nr:acyl-CoA thioesterase [uncultured Megasphaera sp.]MBC3537186.1 acyl-CoA thioesterase [Megasphaera hominis]
MAGKDQHVSAAHMVLGKDLNPHGTLFAGQAAAYFIECGFLAVQAFLGHGHIVCLSLDGLRFLRPVHKDQTIRIDSTLVYAGTSSVGVYLAMQRLPGEEKAAECFTSFVSIEEATGKAVPHGLSLGVLNDETKRLQDLYLAYKGVTVV